MSETLCKHCMQPISDHLIGPVHLAGNYRGKQRCDPDDSGMAYGFNATPEGTECVPPCVGAHQGKLA